MLAMYIPNWDDPNWVSLGCAMGGSNINQISERCIYGLTASIERDRFFSEYRGMVNPRDFCLNNSGNNPKMNQPTMGL